MSDKFMVIVIQFKENRTKFVNAIFEKLTKSIDTEEAKIHIAYQGSDEKIIKALNNILKLTE
jgi:hypothetical protein